MHNQVRSKLLLIILTYAVSVSVWSQTSEHREIPADQPKTASQKQFAKMDRRADRALRRNIYKALARYKEIDAGDISIAVKNGLVTLDGTVRDVGQIGTVERVVRSAPGVLAVTNKLTVQGPFEE